MYLEITALADVIENFTFAYVWYDTNKSRLNIGVYAACIVFVKLDLAILKQKSLFEHISAKQLKY